MNLVFTEFSQYSFLVQFIITFVVTLFLYLKYKSEWLKFEIYFFLFFVLITASNLIAVFFITSSGVPYASVVILSNLALVILLIAGETLMGIRNKILLYVLPLAVFVFDAIVNLLYAAQYPGLTETVFRIITGIDILLFTIPSLVIYANLTYKTKDISLGFFVLALLLYITGGFLSASYGEQAMALFYISAVICFAIATILPIIRNRLHSLSKADVVNA